MKNQQTQTVIHALKRAGIEQGAPLWKRVANELERPSRQRRVVNIFKIEDEAKDGDIIVVPGKVLGEGTLTKSVTVAAHSFSDQAREKISQKGKALSIEELAKESPKGKKVRILG